MNDGDPVNKDEEYWLDRPRNVYIIIFLLIASCIILFFADAFYHKHPHFEIENLFGFFGIYGFFVCVALVIIAKSLRTILMRPEDYYDTPEDTHNDSNLLQKTHE
jgi:Na+-translocating ferredoxin:NAD+ oxidoreductase RnfE subunit